MYFLRVYMCNFFILIKVLMFDSTFSLIMIAQDTMISIENFIYDIIYLENFKNYSPCKCHIYLQQPCIYYGIDSPTRFKEQPFLYLFLFFSWIYKINKNEALLSSLASTTRVCIWFIWFPRSFVAFGFPFLQNPQWLK